MERKSELMMHPNEPDPTKVKKVLIKNDSVQSVQSPQPINSNKFFDKMKYERIRFLTFCIVGREWPKMLMVPPHKMAKAGFFHLKNDDAQCAFCRIILRNWEDDDDPMEAHKRLAPKCPFINGKYVGNVSIGMDPFLTIGPRSQPLTPKYNKSRVPIYNHFVQTEKRMMSFSSPKWANSDPVKEKEFAEAGFFFSGVKDVLICFQCGGSLRNWKPGDVAFEEHANFFPHCSYVNEKKSSDFINFVKYKKEAIELGTKMDSNPELTPAHLDKIQQSLSLKLLHRMKRSYIRIKNSINRAEDASIYMEYFDKPLFFIDLQAVLKLFSEISLINEDENNFSFAVDFNDSAYNSCNSDEDNGVLESDQEKFEVNIGCCICFENEIQVVFVPCGHQLACVGCAIKISNCPVCRKSIESKVRTYFPA